MLLALVSVLLLFGSQRIFDHRVQMDLTLFWGNKVHLIFDSRLRTKVGKTPLVGADLVSVNDVLD